jgi:hypothetical protein
MGENYEYMQICCFKYTSTFCKSLTLTFRCLYQGSPSRREIVGGPCKFLTSNALSGHSVLLTAPRQHHGSQERPRSPSKRYANKQAKVRARRRHRAQERLERDQRQAPRTAEALYQAREDLGLPDTVVAESVGRFRSQQTRLGQIVGVMYPALFGCRIPTALCRVRGWDKH